ncbi:fungal-specific transcription factor domain-containing protein [Xylariomycetidae sp. FL0641]|nr:fungal-specific transcription factor domain-containing protein [Xylariomycetidae sp. FL0641]
MSSQRRSNVRRANVTACNRCKSRKQRCDSGIPSCSSCARAGVECVGSDIDGRIVPRSYLKSLEDRIVYLEKVLATHGITDYDGYDGTHNSEHGGASSTADTASTVSPLPNELNDPSHVSTPGTAEVPRPFGILVQNLVTSSDGDRSDHQSLLDDLPYETTVRFPRRDAALQLLAAYFQHSDFWSPIIAAEPAFQLLGHLYQTDPEVAVSSTKPEAFRLYIIFAIAVRLLHRTDSSIPLTRSEGYHAQAVKVLVKHPALLHEIGQMQLENVLLLIQYALFASNLRAAWYLVGYATRMAVDLGFHQEVTDSSDIEDKNALNMRRWVFWSLYTFERALGGVLGRPFSIPDEDIGVALPINTTSSSTTEAAIHLIKQRQLGSEIQVTLGQNQPINGAFLDYYAWRDNMRQRLLDWMSKAPPPDRESKLTPTDLYEGFLQNSFIQLYFPSPHLPTMTDEELLFLAQSACRVIEIYKSAFREGTLRFYWRTVKNLFQAGVALVHCVKTPTPRLSPGIPLAEVKQAINTCSTVLWGMVERYHAGKTYRDTFEALSSPILKMDDTPMPTPHMHMPVEPRDLSGVFMAPYEDENGYIF